VWKPTSDRLSVIEQVMLSNTNRLTDLLMLRHERMAASPFAYLRGMPLTMARDLANTPHTGILVQSGGDAHLMNFGLFASPERVLLFDITDFDETHLAPWEWDVKRLVASIAIAARQSPLLLDRKTQQDLAYDAGSSYRLHLREYACMTHREIWHSRMTSDDFLDSAPTAKSRSRLEAALRHALQRTGDRLLAKLTTITPEGNLVIREDPPAIVHETDGDFFADNVVQIIIQYRDTLQTDRRQLLERYEIVDVARKVVGVGSVGTRCAIALLRADDGDMLVLQLKEARASILEQFTQPSVYAHPGERIVTGQRMMQSASDPFLGWTQGPSGIPFYVRQLRDMKASVALDQMSAGELREYGKLCGWCLARAHATSGNSAIIGGYLGKDDQFDRALSQFAVAYADQNECDAAAFLEGRRLKKLV
jgi:uncharacterized protein (DUF2252 family)